MWTAAQNCLPTPFIGGTLLAFSIYVSSKPENSQNAGPWGIFHLIALTCYLSIRYSVCFLSTSVLYISVKIGNMNSFQLFQYQKGILPLIPAGYLPAYALSHCIIFRSAFENTCWRCSGLFSSSANSPKRMSCFLIPICKELSGSLFISQNPDKLLFLSRLGCTSWRNI